MFTMFDITIYNQTKHHNKRAADAASDLRW